MLSITVDDLPLSYKNYQVGHKFWEKLSNASYITTPAETTKLKYLSLTIYQSSYGTSFDQTNHIKQNILDTWFDKGHPTEKTNKPIPVDPFHEEDLSQSLPLQNDDLHNIIFC